MSLDPPIDHRSHERGTNTTVLQTLAIIFTTIAALYVGRSFAIPIAIAVLVSFSLGPLVTWIRRQGFGRVPSVAAVMVPALLALAAFGYLIVTQLGYLAGDLPSYQTNVERKIRSLEAILPAQAMLDKGSDFISGLRDTHSLRVATRSPNMRAGSGPGTPRREDAPLPVEIKEPSPTPFSMLTGVAVPLLGPVSQLGLVTLFVTFFLVERETLRDRVIRLAGSHDLHRTTMAMDEASHRLSRFLLSQFVVNSCFGTALGLGLWAIGVPNPAIWGSFAAVFRFVPYLGVVAASAIPLALAIAVDPAWSMLLWTVVLFVCLELVTANVVEPRFYGSSTGLSSVAFVVSAIFWTWLWGAVGLLIATPLTLCIAVLGRHVPQLAFLHVLLGNEAPLRPEESFYQRLLAGHPEEAAQQAEEYLKSGGAAVSFCDEIALPALALAERDRIRGVLDDAGRQQILEGIRIVAENLEDEARKSEAVHSSEQGTATERPGRTILCIPGRGALDEAAAVTIASLLSLEQHDARVGSIQTLRTEGIADVEGSTVPQILLSYMDQRSILRAKYVSRRLRRLFGNGIEVFAAFWGADQHMLQDPEATSSAGLNGVVTSFRDALDKLDGSHVPSAMPFPALEPDLDELARLASEVVAKPVAGSAQVISAEIGELPSPSGAAR